MTARMRALRVVHVNFQEDVSRHAPEALLAAWPTMTEVATAVAQQVVHVAVVHRALVEWTGRPRDDQRRAARRHFEQALSFEVVGKQLRGVYETLAGTR